MEVTEGELKKLEDFPGHPKFHAERSPGSGVQDVGSLGGSRRPSASRRGLVEQDHLGAPDTGTETFSEPPRLVTKEHIEQADIVVSLGCGLHELPTAPRRFVDWSDAPNASEDVDGLRLYLSSRLASLLD